ncbi:MAG: OmpH family outer membrane protein [Chitinophagaceae bacterium]
MKKLLTIAAVTVALLFAGNNDVAAQNKFGYFDLDYVVSLMPGVSKVDTLMQSFERDSLGAEYDFNLGELKRMDSTFKADSIKLAPRVREQMQQQMAQLFYTVQNWQQYAQQISQGKQQQLMQPFLAKAINAFQAIVAEQKYTYVFKRESLWQAPEGDNLIIPVAKRLGLKLPQAEQQGQEPGKAPAKTPVKPRIN